MRITITVTLTREHSYEVAGYLHGRYETRHIYTFTDADGRVYVWKTATVAGIDTDGGFDPARAGDVMTITATEAGVGEYRGVAHIVLQRVKVNGYLTRGESREEREARKAEAQRASLTGEDFIWRMPYRQYKDHYSDCETVAGSFIGRDDPRSCGEASIAVIIREGRLKASGVRGRHYAGYEFSFNSGGKQIRACYYAISEETAMRRLLKEYPDATDITPGQIFTYAGSMRGF